MMLLGEDVPLLRLSAEAQEARGGNSAPHLSACPKVVSICRYAADEGLLR
jgi:hypothetical protein